MTRFPARDGINLLAAAANELNGVRTAVLLGENTLVDIPTAGFGGINNLTGGAIYTSLTPTAMEIVSTAATDTAPAGTGARVVEVDMLDANWKEVTHQLEMDGVTPVAIPGGTYLRCNSIRLITAGGNAPDGRITVDTDPGGVEVCAVDIDQGISKSGMFTVPDKHGCLIIGMSVAIRTGGNSYAAWQLFERSQLDGEPVRRHRLYGVNSRPNATTGAGGVHTLDIVPNIPLYVKGPADLWMAGNSDTAVIPFTRVQARTDLLLIRET